VFRYMLFHGANFGLNGTGVSVYAFPRSKFFKYLIQTVSEVTLTVLCVKLPEVVPARLDLFSSSNLRFF
jgi:hypothetical protein